MSEKSAKKLRRLARKTFRYHYKEFLADAAKLKILDRIRIAWQVIKNSTKKKENIMDRFIRSLFYPAIISLAFLVLSGLAAWIILIMYFLGAFNA